MNTDSLNDTSKYLSYLLRHRPETIGLELDRQGWAQVAQLIERAALVDGRHLTTELITQVVATNDKKRFQLSEDGARLRAVQGHSSTDVDRDFKKAVPPVELFHGTASTSVASIRKQGLLPRNRQYVHLSKDAEIARKVGSRHGKPVILTVDCKAMLRDGHAFYLAENGVWLVEVVPAKYLAFPMAAA